MELALNGRRALVGGASRGIGMASAVELAKLGAEVVYSGSVMGELVADEKWDVIALVRYPNFRVFIDLFADDAYGKEVEVLRRSALMESRFLVTTA